MAGLIYALVADYHLTGEDHRLRAGPVFGQPALYDNLIEPLLCHIIALWDLTCG
jgi:hypothetical protein